MAENNLETNTTEEEYYFRNSFNKRIGDFNFLWRNKFKIALACVVGGIIGVLITFVTPVTYTARTTFVVEETKSGGGGMLSSLAGQMGFDLGGMMGGSGGVLAGDNVLQLLISKKLIKESLLTPITPGSKRSLADKYAEVYKYKAAWKEEKNDPLDYFPPLPATYTRRQDSLLHILLDIIAEKQIAVTKPDKKLSFFAFTATFKDQELASFFVRRLIDQASKFYIQTKTMQLSNNVGRLQHRADSIGRLLNKKTYASSASTVSTLDLNEAYATASVPSEIQERDKRALQTIYSELIKNLEMSRTMLSQETPTFQLIDVPELPLKKNHLRKSTAGIGGVIIAGIAICIFLIQTRQKRQATVNTTVS